MLDGTLRRHKDGTVTFSGIDHGGPGKILAECEKFMVIKWPRNTSWGGVLGGRVYNPSTVCVYARTVKRSGHKNLPIESMRGVIEWEVTRQKKKEEEVKKRG